MPAGATVVKRAEGFTLTELLLAMALGLVVAGVVMQGLIASGRSGERLALQMRERTFQRRTLGLMRAELGAAESWQAGSGTGAACPLAGRTAGVQLVVQGKTIVYSVGAAPSPIWRGMVLMRCGPAYGLAGELSSGAAQNRVMLDGLAPAPEGLLVLEEAPGLLRLRLKQQMPLRGGAFLPITMEVMAPAPGG
jgi:prepilin-type N-terminal cleavage/methylation domain-containing protein